MRENMACQKTSATRRLRSLKTKAAKIDVILTDLYGRKEIEGDEDPMDTLVETILSQNTTDKNSHRAFQKLKRAYPGWEHMIGASPKRVADLIRSGGLAGIKAERILDALEFIKKSRGELRLDFLRSLTPSQADAWLAQMKGVGPKTRGIILLFALRMPAFPVDTHIHRVTKRLGLIGQKTSREMAQEELAEIVPPPEYYNFHINLIEHGRAVCQARRPRCSACKIRRFCDYYSKRPPART
jgi:endonuclease-3